jgi:hypothetical protein
MYLMTFVSQGFPQFGGQNATSSIGRITNNTDPHAIVYIGLQKNSLIVMQR